MKKKVFITGISGMVGSHLTEYLCKNTNFNIFGLIRWNSKLHNIFHLNKYIKNKRLKLINGDLLDENSINQALKLVKPHYIFHLAAHSYPTTSFISPKETLSTNVLGTLNILESVKLLNLKKTVVHICSSSEVFGKVERKNIPIKEDNAYHPASPYAISKVGADLLGKYYADAYGLNTQITRMFTHTGPRRSEFFAESTFAKQIIMIEKKIIPPTIHVGNLKSLRTWADVRDAVRAYYMLLTINPVPGEYYNIGGNFTCTVGDMLNHLISSSKTNKNIKVVVDKSRLRPLDADLQIPDTSKFREHTGWEPEFKFEDTMRDLLDYWRMKIKKDKLFLSR